LRNVSAQDAAEDSDEQAAVADELAYGDCSSVVGVIYCLSLRNALDLDICSAVVGKLQTYGHHYAADEVTRWAQQNVSRAIAPIGTRTRIACW
jgi:hypothetical protein